MGDTPAGRGDQPAEADVQPSEAGPGRVGLASGTGEGCGARAVGVQAEEAEQVGRGRAESARPGQGGEVPMRGWAAAAVMSGGEAAVVDVHAGSGEPERLADAAADELVVAGARPQREQVPEQADAVVRVAKAPLRGPSRAGARDRRLEPGCVPARVGVVALRGEGTRKLAARQRREPGAVRGEVGEGDLPAPGGHLHPGGQMQRDAVVDPKQPVLRHVGEQRGGEHLGDRADLEHRPGPAGRSPRWNRSMRSPPLQTPTTRARCGRRTRARTRAAASAATTGSRSSGPAARAGGTRAARARAGRSGW